MRGLVRKSVAWVKVVKVGRLEEFIYVITRFSVNPSSNSMAGRSEMKRSTQYRRLCIRACG